MDLSTLTFTLFCSATGVLPNGTPLVSAVRWIHEPPHSMLVLVPQPSGSLPAGAWTPHYLADGSDGIDFAPTSFGDPSAAPVFHVSCTPEADR